MNPSPTVSVVIPTYAHRDFVMATLESVWAQTFTDYEVIVVNDGSPDDTDTVLRPLAAAERIVYLTQENAGQAAARNRGVAVARGEFIALLDDDDLWPSDKLARQMAAMRAHPDVALVYGPAIPIRADGAPIGALERAQLPIDIWDEGPSGDVHAAFALRNYILSPGQTLIRRATLPQQGPFDTALWGCDDLDLWLRLAERGKFLFLPGVPALHYRVHPGNASRHEARLHLNEMRLYQKHIIRHAGDPVRRTAIRAGWQARGRTLTRYWLLQSLRAGSRGDLRAGADRLRVLLRLLFGLVPAPRPPAARGRMVEWESR